MVSVGSSFLKTGQTFSSLISRFLEKVNNRRRNYLGLLNTTEKCEKQHDYVILAGLKKIVRYIEVR